MNPCACAQYCACTTKLSTWRAGRWVRRQLELHSAKVESLPGACKDSFCECMFAHHTWCEQVTHSESVILEYEERMLSLRPLGGSVTTLRLRCRMPMGKRSVGSVVSHSRKSCSSQAFRCHLVTINPEYTYMGHADLCKQLHATGS